MLRIEGDGLPAVHDNIANSFSAYSEDRVASGLDAGGRSQSNLVISKDSDRFFGFDDDISTASLDPGVSFDVGLHEHGGGNLEILAAQTAESLGEERDRCTILDVGEGLENRAMANNLNGLHGLPFHLSFFVAVIVINGLEEDTMASTDVDIGGGTFEEGDASGVTVVEMRGGIDVDATLGASGLEEEGRVLSSALDGADGAGVQELELVVGIEVDDARGGVLSVSDEAHPRGGEGDGIKGTADRSLRGVGDDACAVAVITFSAEEQAIAVVGPRGGDADLIEGFKGDIGILSVKRDSASLGVELQAVVGGRDELDDPTPALLGDAVDYEVAASAEPEKVGADEGDSSLAGSRRDFDVDVSGVRIGFQVDLLGGAHREGAASEDDASGASTSDVVGVKVEDAIIIVDGEGGG